MSKDNVLALKNPEIAGEASDILNAGAARLSAADAGASDRSRGCRILKRYRFDKDQAARRRVVCNGYLSEDMAQDNNRKSALESGFDHYLVELVEKKDYCPGRLNMAKH